MQIKYNFQETSTSPEQNQQKHEQNVSDELESRFQEALKDKSSREQQEKIRKRNQQQHNNDKEINNGKSHSDKEVEPNLLNTPENLNAEINNKQKLAAEEHHHRQRKKIIDGKVQQRDPEHTEKASDAKPKSAPEEAYPKIRKAQVRLDSEHKAEVPTNADNLTPSRTQGDIILKSLEAQASPKAVRDVNELISQLVDKIYVSLPKANDKEVRLLLNEGLLKGGEISIKQDNSGYSVLIKQEHAHSLISQNARVELSERLQRLGLDHPVRVNISEQMNNQHDQQHSRQQRNIYDEWNPEDE
ncbi:hypothetical protein VIBC2010_01318 [Vibrio caribbeanicus ATCC BAA-2122]|uniref:Type III secretion system needle length determinant n=1 Tax=Vibrio caribbeanicus ATCC BAA-2122 TaxID=796620 RepID=E3BLU5_9VIBR|nr:type III secretion system needle length determinant [Vibrio caribbeanicus]EFP95873.1 hypothetical protein VIBC2010_01318 [Vibrio caribbeanicus ATCC BAA-2122]